MNEEWKPVVGAEGYYEVSNLGRVRSVSRLVRHSNLKDLRPAKGRVLKLKAYPNGYLFVSLSQGGAVKERQVSHLVLEAFVGPRPKGYNACHNNGNQKDNRLVNLRWDSTINNAGDKRAHGTHLEGEAVHLSVLTEEQVRAIRLEYRVYSKRKTNATELAEKYKVARMTIFNIVWGNSWKHVNPPVAPDYLRFKREQVD